MKNRPVRKLVLSFSIAALAIAAFLTPTPLRAQAGAGDSKGISPSKVERKNRAPVSKEILRVKLPRPAEVTLPNGLSVFILEDHRFPLVTVQFILEGSGSLRDSGDQPGLASATAQMLREGTATRNSRQIGEEIDRLGATFAAFAPFGSNATTIQASGLSDNFEQWFGLTTELLLHPSFPADELSKLKQRLKVSLLQQRQQPGFLANERFSRAVYGSHPARVISATPQSVEALTSEMLTKWHHEHYAPQNALLGIAGDVKTKELAEKLKSWLAGWQKTEAKVDAPAATNPVAGRNVLIVNRPNSVQTTLAMGNIAINRTNPDYPTMVVLDQVLGAGASGRLFLNLREEKGYTYGVYSNFVARKYAGPWRVGGDLRTEVTEGAMTEFVKEINRIRDEKVPEKELDEARHAVVAGFALSLEQPTQLLGYAVERKIYDLPADYWDTYPAKISAVTTDEVQRIARKYIQPEVMQIVAVGDAPKIKPVLEKYGPVEVFDVQGKPEATKPETPKPTAH
jgi:zinc protease